VAEGFRLLPVPRRRGRASGRVHGQAFVHRLLRRLERLAPPADDARGVGLT
jgi:hypothetical protein